MELINKETKDGGPISVHDPGRYPNAVSFLALTETAYLIDELRKVKQHLLF